MHNYTGVPTVLTTIPLPDDGVDLRAVASVNGGMQALADAIAFYARRQAKVDFLVNASGTWTCPPDVTEVLAIGWGGGGGGGGGAGNTTTVTRWIPGGGGGAGSVAGIQPCAVTPSTVYNYTIGAAGAGGAAGAINTAGSVGGDGGTTIFSSATPANFPGGQGGGVCRISVLASTTATIGCFSPGGQGCTGATQTNGYQLVGSMSAGPCGSGGWGGPSTGSNTAVSGGCAGVASLQGFAGGAAGVTGNDSGTSRGGGPGGGGGGGPFGAGGAGGFGGAANGAGIGGVGGGGTAPLTANGGAGGGGGGAAGCGTSGNTGGAGAVGQTGGLWLIYFGAQAVIV